MKKPGKFVATAPDRLILLGVVLGVFFWVLESFMHSYFFREHFSNMFVELFNPGAHEIWMRLTVFAMFILFGAYSRKIISARRKAEEDARLASTELILSSRNLTCAYNVCIHFNMKVIWDPEKAKSNIRKHKVRFSDAEPVFFDPMALTREDDDSEGEQRFVSIGLML